MKAYLWWAYQLSSESGALRLELRTVCGFLNKVTLSSGTLSPDGVQILNAHYHKRHSPQMESDNSNV